MNYSMQLRARMIASSAAAKAGILHHHQRAQQTPKHCLLRDRLKTEVFAEAQMGNATSGKVSGVTMNCRFRVGGDTRCWRS